MYEQTDEEQAAKKIIAKMIINHLNILQSDLKEFCNHGEGKIEELKSRFQELATQIRPIVNIQALKTTNQVIREIDQVPEQKGFIAQLIEIYSIYAEKSTKATLRDRVEDIKKIINSYFTCNEELDKDRWYGYHPRRHFSPCMQEKAINQLSDLISKCGHDFNFSLNFGPSVKSARPAPRLPNDAHDRDAVSTNALLSIHRRVDQESVVHHHENVQI